MEHGMQLLINFTDKLAVGTRVKRNDGVHGYIESFGHRFSPQKNPYDAYYVRWCDGKLGFPNESSFQVIL